jgi:hypothetical protein
MCRSTKGRSGGSSLRIAVIVSAVVSRWNVRRPESISWRTQPNAKMSVRYLEPDDSSHGEAHVSPDRGHLRGSNRHGLTLAGEDYVFDSIDAHYCSTTVRS